MRTVTVVMTYMLGTALLAGGCTREESAGSGKREAVILSIAEANYGASGGARRSATAPANGGAPQTRAIVDGGGSTFFTDRDRLGLFLRGDGYEDVDNRIVQLDYPGEGPRKKWNITGEVIPLYADAAIVTAYFPYSDAYGLTMSAVPLLSGRYDVNTNDVVWQRDTVHSTRTQAMFLEMQHAMTRVKIRLNRGTSDTSDPGDYTGEGKITGVRIADAGDVAADDRVVYLDGTLDLTQATPVVTPGWPDAVADKSEKTLTAEGVLYDLLLLPVDKIDAGKVMLEVELDGKSLSAPFPVDAVDKWEAGKAYTYEVAVRNGAAQVVFGKATVTPWNDGGSISGSLDPSKPEYGGGDVQDWGDNEWGAEEGDDEPVTGEIADASLVPPPTDNVIPAEGGEYSVRLTGNWTGSVPVRMSVGGNIGGLLHAACSNGAATVTFTVPANAAELRDIIWEYRWENNWIVIATAKQRRLIKIYDEIGGGLVYWINPDDKSDFLIIDKGMTSAAWTGIPLPADLVEQLNDSDLTGDYVQSQVKSFSDGATNGATGNFANDFPAFNHCYSLSDGDAPAGTWYLPSLNELKKLSDVRSSTLFALGFTFHWNSHWTATFVNGDRAYAYTPWSGYVGAKGLGDRRLLHCIRKGSTVNE